MRYLVRVKYNKLKDKDKERFLTLMSRKHFQKAILHKTETAYIITVPLFDALNLEFEGIKAYRKGLRYDLLVHNTEKNDVKVLILEDTEDAVSMDNFSYRSPRYAEMLRRIRFSRT